jgi:predicted transcriptional regulator
LEAERQLAITRWEKFRLTGEIVDHSDVKAWASSLSTAPGSRSN